MREWKVSGDIFCLTGISFHQSFNLLKTKCKLLYIRYQFLPRSKHFPPRL